MHGIDLSCFQVFLDVTIAAPDPKIADEQVEEIFAINPL